MANVRFNIDKDYLFCIYYIGGARFKMSMSEKVEKKHWSNKMQKVKATHKNYIQLNKMISIIRDHIDEIRLEYKIDGKSLTPALLKIEVNKKLYGDHTNTFQSYAREWMATRQVRATTARTYANFINQICLLYPGLRFEDMTKKWYDDYLAKMADKSINYKYRILKTAKDIMKNAHIDGLHQNTFYQSSSFKIRQEKSENIYLTLDDINNIYMSINNLDDRLRNAAIIFLIGCYSGQRHQTYSILKKSMIAIVGDNEMISINTEKTTTRVSIPLIPKLKNLLDIGYKPISQQKLNKYIKEVCQLCGIKNHDKVSSHTARRSFATNAVLAGIDITYIMKITGHATESEFRKYVKIDDVISAGKVANDIVSLFA
jgi:integrase